jgi:hypothetical protein
MEVEFSRLCGIGTNKKDITLASLILSCHVLCVTVDVGFVLIAGFIDRYQLLITIHYGSMVNSYSIAKTEYLGMLSLHHSSGNGFPWLTFSFVWVPQLSFVSATGILVLERTQM